MNRYNILGQVGDGSFGVVSKAQQVNTGEIVAIKKMKQTFESWDECLQLREVQSLRKIHHPNVVKLKEVVREKNELFLVIEFCEQNVFEITRQRVAQMKCKSAFNEREIRSIMCQTLLGVQAIHKNGFMHRDLKPENLLVKGDIVKVADFGLAKEIRSRPPFTEYVSTRWYRAPELVLHSRHYNSPVDIWACGVIFAELLLCRPLFPGQSESDQLFKICSIIGSPSPSEWDEGHQLARRLNVRFPVVIPTPLRHVLRDAPVAAVSLIEQMLRFNPNERLTAMQCLQHPYFTETPHSGLALYAGISTGQPHNPFQPICESQNNNNTTTSLAPQHMALCKEALDEGEVNGANRLCELYNGCKRGSISSLSSTPPINNNASTNVTGVAKYANLFMANTSDVARRNSSATTSSHAVTSSLLSENVTDELPSCNSLHSSLTPVCTQRERNTSNGVKSKPKKCHGTELNDVNTLVHNQANDDLFNF